MLSARTALPRRIRLLLAPQISARSGRSSYSQLVRSWLQRFTASMIHPYQTVVRPLVSMQNSRSQDGNSYYCLWIASALMMCSWNWGATPDPKTEDSMDPKPKDDSLWSRLVGVENMNSFWDTFLERSTTRTQCCGIAGVVGTRNHDARFVIYRLLGQRLF